MAYESNQHVKKRVSNRSWSDVFMKTSKKVILVDNFYNMYIGKRNSDFVWESQYTSNHNQFDTCIATCRFYSYAMIA